MLCEVLLDIAGEFAAAAAADDATADAAGSSDCELAEWWSAAPSTAVPIGIGGVGCNIESAAALSTAAAAAADGGATEATDEAPEGTGEGMGLRAKAMEGSGGLATPRPRRGRAASLSGGGEVAAPAPEPVCSGERRAVCAVGGGSCSCVSACDCVWRSSACIT